MRFVAGFVITLFAISTARADFTFVHVSDIHVGARIPGGGPENADVDAKLFREIASLDPKPAFIVNTGDTCEIGGEDQYARYQQVIEQAQGIAMYVAPGNHDVRWNPHGKEGFVLGAKQPLYQSWDYQNVHFVLLDSTVLLEHWGHISQDQMDWLRKDLEKVGTERPVIIGFHHWVGRNPVMVDNEPELFKLVKPYNVVLWLQGHGHANIDWSIDGVRATMVGALYDGNYHIIKVSNDKIDIVQRSRKEGKKGKGGELLTEASTQPVVEDSTTQPGISRIAAFKELMTITTQRQGVPKWAADVKRVGEKPEEYSLQVSAKRGELPEGTSIDFRLNSEKIWPLNPPSSDFSTSIPARHEPMTLTWGEQTVTVSATLPDKRGYQIPIDLEVPGEIKPAWSKNVGGAIQSRLVRDGDLLYVSTMGNDLVALDARSGDEKFRFKTGGSIFSAPCVDKGVAYIGSADHFVYAVDARTGDQKWKCETGGAVLAGPAVAKGIVCVGSVDTKIYGIDASTGSIIWTVAGANMFQSQTATDGTRFFVGGWDNHFRCIDASSGNVLWDLPLGKKQSNKSFSPFAPAITAPAVGDGNVFVSSNDGVLHSIAIEDGKERWHINWLKMGYSSPLYREKLVYCALSDEGKTFCVDASTGEPKWITNTDSVIYDSSFAYGNDHVFIGNVNGVLNCIKAEDGKIAWQYRIGPGHFLGSPAADDKFVYAGTMAGTIVALPIELPKDEKKIAKK